MKILNDIEQIQYARQINLAEIGVLGQQKLKNTSVLLVGIGGLGCPILLYLASAGIGTIGIVDSDLVDVSNIPRQILYGFDDIAKPKVIVAKSKIETYNKELLLNTFFEKITSLNVQSIINQYDIVVDCTDNFDSRYVINDACQELKKKLVYASIYKFEGQITVFDFNNNHSLRTLFPHKPEPKAIPSCSELGVLNTHAAIIGLFQANEVLKLILGMGKPLIGKVFNFNTLTMENHIFSYSSYQTESQTVIYIEKNDFMELILSNQKIELIDLREKHDFFASNLGGKNIPFSEFDIDKTILPESTQIYFICKTGNKSSLIAEKVAKKFHKINIYSVVGGIDNL